MTKKQFIEQATFVFYRETKEWEPATYSTFDENVSEGEIAAMERRNYD